MFVYNVKTMQFQVKFLEVVVMPAIREYKMSPQQHGS